ncbi:hypothetical protein HRR83_005935 [Exophiala dermatitidis]|nr:hypothetical protein HRR75_007423 [Exophiala dermatitidis]KAJ4507168.1 hypothetical protein HRR74_008091 [Exophiala dermatitidis]KAJ4517358.1 hypothetical protein HRR73_004410 [Exophiala dermatitidis]KAJ4550670.1 hypothetical protein HRR78_004439 [Exophiala dermatitidis]KAJ4579078.1 hypothetical protein HRR81_003229 [Exophiala dermatitidis]
MVDISHRRVISANPSSPAFVNSPPVEEFGCFDEESCRYFLREVGTRVVPCYPFLFGMEEVYSLILERFGYQGMADATSLLQEFLETDNAAGGFGDDGDIWRSWRHSWKHRNDDRLRPFIPKIGNFVLPEPTQRHIRILKARNFIKKCERGLAQARPSALASSPGHQNQDQAGRATPGQTGEVDLEDAYVLPAITYSHQRARTALASGDPAAANAYVARIQQSNRARLTASAVSSQQEFVEVDPSNLTPDVDRSLLLSFEMVTNNPTSVTGNGPSLRGGEAEIITLQQVSSPISPESPEEAVVATNQASSRTETSGLPALASVEAQSTGIIEQSSNKNVDSEPSDTGIQPDQNENTDTLGEDEAGDDQDEVLKGAGRNTRVASGEPLTASMRARARHREFRMVDGDIFYPRSPRKRDPSQATVLDGIAMTATGTRQGSVVRRSCTPVLQKIESQQGWLKNTANSMLSLFRRESQSKKSISSSQKLKSHNSTRSAVNRRAPSVIHPSAAAVSAAEASAVRSSPLETTSDPATSTPRHLHSSSIFPRNSRHPTALGVVEQSLSNPRTRRNRLKRFLSVRSTTRPSTTAPSTSRPSATTPTNSPPSTVEDSVQRTLSSVSTRRRRRSAYSFTLDTTTGNPSTAPLPIPPSSTTEHQPSPTLSRPAHAFGLDGAFDRLAAVTKIKMSDFNKPLPLNPSEVVQTMAARHQQSLGSQSRRSYQPNGANGQPAGWYTSNNTGNYHGLYGPIRVPAPANGNYHGYGSARAPAVASGQYGGYGQIRAPVPVTGNYRGYGAIRAPIPERHQLLPPWLSAEQYGREAQEPLKPVRQPANPPVSPIGTLADPFTDAPKFVPPTRPANPISATNLRATAPEFVPPGERMEMLPPCPRTPSLRYAIPAITSSAGSPRVVPPTSISRTNRRTSQSSLMLATPTHRPAPAPGITASSTDTRRVGLPRSILKKSRRDGQLSLEAPSRRQAAPGITASSTDTRRVDPPRSILKPARRASQMPMESPKHRPASPATTESPTAAARAALAACIAKSARRMSQVSMKTPPRRPAEPATTPSPTRAAHAALEASVANVKRQMDQLSLLMNTPSPRPADTPGITATTRVVAAPRSILKKPSRRSSEPFLLEDTPTHRPTAAPGLTATTRDVTAPRSILKPSRRSSEPSRKTETPSRRPATPAAIPADASPASIRRAAVAITIANTNRRLSRASSMASTDDGQGVALAGSSPITGTQEQEQIQVRHDHPQPSQIESYPTPHVVGPLWAPDSIWAANNNVSDTPFPPPGANFPYCPAEEFEGEDVEDPASPRTISNLIPNSLMRAIDADDADVGTPSRQSRVQKPSQASMDSSFGSTDRSFSHSGSYSTQGGGSGY